MKVQEKMWNEQIWEEEDRKAQLEEYSGVMVSDQAAAEEASERVVEAAIRRKVVEKEMEDAVERTWIRQIQVSFQSSLDFVRNLTSLFSSWNWR